jgi:hypothetical protein
MVLPNQPAAMQVQPSSTSVARDMITLQFDDGTVRNISLLTIPTGSQGNCANLNLQWRTPAALGTLELQVVDDCGNPIGSANGSVMVTFSNQDRAVNLTHIGNGIWTGTWNPANPSAAPITLTASAVTLEPTRTQVIQMGQSITRSVAAVQ